MLNYTVDSYEKMFGTICDEAVAMAKCACVACNSCTYACSCRNIPDLDDINKPSRGSSEISLF